MNCYWICFKSFALTSNTHSMNSLTHLCFKGRCVAFDKYLSPSFAYFIEEIQLSSATIKAICHICCTFAALIKNLLKHCNNNPKIPWLKITLCYAGTVWHDEDPYLSACRMLWVATTDGSLAYFLIFLNFIMRSFVFYPLLFLFYVFYLILPPSKHLCDQMVIVYKTIYFHYIIKLST